MEVQKSAWRKLEWRIVKDVSCIRTYVECTFNVLGKRCATYSYVRMNAIEGHPLLRTNSPLPPSSPEGRGCAPFSLKLFYNFRPAFLFPWITTDLFGGGYHASPPCFQLFSRRERKRERDSFRPCKLRIYELFSEEKMSTCVWALFNLTGISGRGKGGQCWIN